MRLNRPVEPGSVPVVMLSHRKREFVADAIVSLRRFGVGLSDLTVVDDSGDHDHHVWLDTNGFQFSLSDTRGRNVGYLSAMNTVWETARRVADEAGSDHVLLWEEDFFLKREVDVRQMVTIMRENPRLAQLNLQRQSVYRVERRFGYLESHERRGYGLSRECSQGTEALPWVRRQRPFTTNPGLIRRSVLDEFGGMWPPRDMCDAVPGGAEPAMSLLLEEQGWEFGWYGSWNTPYTKHVGADLKSGHGY